MEIMRNIIGIKEFSKMRCIHLISTIAKDYMSEYLFLQRIKY